MSESDGKPTPSELPADPIVAENNEQAESERASRESQTKIRAKTEKPIEGDPAFIAPNASQQTRTANQVTTSEAVGPDVDPVEEPMQAAAQAIAKLRQRAKTDIAELRTQYHRHDVFVLVGALLIMVISGRMHRNLVTPPTKQFSERGLSFSRSTAWLDPEPVELTPSRLARSWDPISPTARKPYHVAFTSTIDPTARFEVFVDDKPSWSNIVTGLEVDRRNRWGELYSLEDSSVVAVAGLDWLKTTYRFAHVSSLGEAPIIDHAVEYATVDLERIYIVTFFGSPSAIARMEETTVPTLRVPSKTGAPLVPQVGRASGNNEPNAVANAYRSTVMVVVADLVDGRLQPRGGGSGVVVGNDGSILTNYHVVHDRNGRIHDVFIIGQGFQTEKAPRLVCAGKPSRSKLAPEVDLALLKCDMDLDGKKWNPRSIAWQPIPIGKKQQYSPGTRLWVLGYPDVGGGGLKVSQGAIEGFTGEDGSIGQDYIKTDAAISHGNSGGPVVTDDGSFVGVASAFRTRIIADDKIVEVSKLGLVRPVAAASDLLTHAQTGWTPTEGKTKVDIEPAAVEATAEGVHLGTKITDFANGSPIRDALIIVLRPGISASSVDMNRLDDQVIAWGKSNSVGEVRLKQPVPVPGTYSVVVFAKGYQTLLGDNELRLKADTPADYDPWGGVTLEAR